ncbi:hypothetical protein [Ruegeria atlantica]|uniref:hypothetical protein n=1 Tax=Ruegeria atlantica TaxID=81569 RepID=UPI0024950CD5|nr:hypothetical protein [Ruegeria atlantica]
MRWRILSLAFVYLAVSASLLHARGTETVWEKNYLETAQSYCVPQVEAVMQNAEQTAKRLSEAKIEWDYDIPESQHRAFNKMGAWSIVMANQHIHLTIYMNTIREGHPDAGRLVNANQSLLEMLDCLWPAREDRDLIDQMVLSTPMDESGEGLTYSSSDFLFSTLDLAECYRWREASRRVLEIPQQSKDAQTRMYEVLQDTVGQCEESL